MIERIPSSTSNIVAFSDNLFGIISTTGSTRCMMHDAGSSMINTSGRAVIHPVLASCRQLARPGGRARQIELLCIPTANRISAFDRAARSYLSNAREFGHRVELVVADDSASADTRKEYRENIAQLAREFAVPAWYAGAEEKSGYAAHLVRESGVPRPLIDFALQDPFQVGYHPGANRNALFLHTAGRVFFCADDDTICRPAGVSPPFRGMRLSAVPDPTLIRPYEDFAAIEHDLLFRNADILGDHRQVLGADVGTLLQEFPDVALEVTNPSVMRAIGENQLRVAVSWNGIAGDCGYRIPAFLFKLPDQEMARFTRDEGVYRRMLVSRQVHRFCDRLTITPGGYCQSTALAFDHRQPLPPFLPVFRGEDMIFGRLLPLFCPGAGIAYQPTSILHVPLAPRENSDAVLAGIGQHRSQNGLILGLLKMAMEMERSEKPRSMPEIIKSARQALQHELFESFAISSSRSETEQMVQSNLIKLWHFPNAPAFWREDLSAIVRSLQSDECRHYVYPEELARSHAPEERFPVLRATIGSYFDLIEAWPTLWRAAIRLREEQGITPARRLDPA